MARKLRKDAGTLDVDEYDWRAVTYKYSALDPVRNGAKYLDATYPGWARRVNLHTFNMEYDALAILAQVHGESLDYCVELCEWTTRARTAHGFIPTAEGDVASQVLTYEWRSAIRDRTHGAPR